MAPELRLGYGVGPECPRTVSRSDPFGANGCTDSRSCPRRELLGALLGVRPQSDDTTPRVGSRGCPALLSDQGHSSGRRVEPKADLGGGHRSVRALAPDSFGRPDSGCRSTPRIGAEPLSVVHALAIREKVGELPEIRATTSLGGARLVLPRACAPCGKLARPSHYRPTSGTLCRLGGVTGREGDRRNLPHAVPAPGGETVGHFCRVTGP